VSPVKYELGFYISDDDILHSRRCEHLTSYSCRKLAKPSEYVAGPILGKVDTGPVTDPTMKSSNTPSNPGASRERGIPQAIVTFVSCDRFGTLLGKKYGTVNYGAVPRHAMEFFGNQSSEFIIRVTCNSLCQTFKSV
jgi:hypothetical protein